MAKKDSDSVLLAQFAGLRNTVGSERLTPQELEVALNVDIDDAGELHRRRGATKVASGAYHSLFTSAGRMYVVKDGNLCRLFPNYTTTQIKAGVGQDPIVYVQVGDDVYFSSRSHSGVIDGSHQVSAWGAEVSPGTWLSPVINPTDSLPAVRGKLLGAPPLATALAYLNGRIYLANERTVWATELYLYHYVDQTKNYLFFESEVTALGSVQDGLYVGTEDAVYYLTGPFNEMRRIQVTDYGALPGPMVPVPSELVLKDEANKTALLFLTKSGLCAALPDGACYNLTQTRVVLPQSDRVAAMFRRQDGMNQFVGVAESAGTPTSSARVGDYVSAEIRRFQGA